MSDDIYDKDEITADLKYNLDAVRDEFARLRAENERLRAEKQTLTDDCAVALTEEVTQLRAALQKIASYYEHGAVTAAKAGADVEVPEIARAALEGK